MNMRKRLKIWRILYRHAKRALAEFKMNAEIGERGTPAISFWNMKKKWEKHGNYWEHIGSDGDIDFRNGSMHYPARLQLVYIRVPKTNNVIQLAYRIL